MDRHRHQIKIDADTENARRQIRELGDDLRSVDSLRTRVELTIDDDSLEKLRAELEARRPEIEVDADTAKAEAEITAVARDRHLVVHMDTDGLAKLVAMNMALRAAYISALAATGAFLLVGPAAAIAGGAIIAGLGGGFIAAAAIALHNNVEIQNSFTKLKETATEVFTSAAAPMKDALVDALETVTQTLVNLKGAFADAFEATVPLVQPLVDGLMALATNAMPGIVTAMQNALPVFNGLRDGLANFGAGLSGMFEGLAKGAEGFGDGLNITFSQLGVFMSTLGQGFGVMAKDGAVVLDGLLGGINNLTNGLLKGLGGALQQMGGPFSAFLREFGSSIGKALEKILPAIGGFVAKLAPAMEPILDLFGGSFSDMIVGLINSFIPVLEKMTPYIKDAATAFGTILEKIEPMLPILGPLAAGLWLVNAAIAANPVTLIVGAISLFAIGLVMLEQKTQVFSNTWKRIWPTLKPFVTPVKDAVDDLAGLIADIFGRNDDPGPTPKNFDDIGTAAQNNTPKVGGFGAAIRNSLGPQLVTTIANLMIAWDGLVENLRTGIARAIPDFGQFYVKFKPLFDLLGNLKVLFVDLVQVVWKAYNGAIRPVMDGVSQVIQGAIGAFGGFLAAVSGDMTAISRIVSGTWTAITGAFTNSVTLIRNLINSAMQWFVAPWQWLYDTLVGHSIIPDLLNRILELFMWLPNKILAIPQKFVSDVINIFSTMGTTVFNTVRDTFEKMRETIPGIISALTGKIGEIWDGVRGTFAKPINFVIDIWNNHVAGKFGIPGMDKIPGFARGGDVDGVGNQDTVLAALTPGEHVLTREEVSAFGGHDAVRKLRASAVHRANGGDIELSPHQQTLWGAVSSAFPDATLNSGMRYQSVGSGFDMHMQGKAIDVGGPMFDIADMIVSKYLEVTSELIHGDGYQHNIMDGVDVGDGMSAYGAGTMADHGGGNSHVHWGTEAPIADTGDGGNILQKVWKKVSGGARALVSGIFNKLTNPLLGAIPDPMAPLGQPIGAFPKSAATKLRDGFSDWIKGAEKAAGAHVQGVGTLVGGGGDLGEMPSGDRLSIIDQALALTNTPPPGSKEAWQRGMNTLITRESNWNPNAINLDDSNAAAGHPSQGLTQTIPGTFAAHAVPGHTDINSPVDNVAASINYIKSEYGSIENVQQANANMPAKGYETGTTNADTGWAIVGENGPEAVKFRGREPVKSFDDIVRALQDPQLDLQNRGTKAIGDFFKANADQLGSDLGMGSGGGSGVIPALINEGSKAVEEHIHYHVTNIDEAMKKENQRRREAALGFHK